MGSCVKGQGGTLGQRQVPGPSLLIREAADFATPSTAAQRQAWISMMAPLLVPANAGLGLQQMDFRRGLCSIRSVATEART